MKYGRITYFDKNIEVTEYTNIGDWCQTFAIDNIYNQLGIDKEDIVNINRNDLSKYRGEKLLVVIQADCRQLAKNDFFPLSRDIVPVYLGVHRTQKKHILQSIDKKEVIGCRDEATFKMFCELGYDAFISGCLTITLPKRPVLGEYTELYLVDVPHELEPFVPSEYDGHIHKITHEIFNRENPEEDSRKQYEEYRDKAKLVVTSRLHCLVPCLAMGIPVILVRSYYDDRYSFVEKYVKPYTVNELGDINWNVSAVDIDEIRGDIFNIAQHMISEKTKIDTLLDCKEEEFNPLSIQKVHSHYMNRNRIKYKAPFKARLYWFFYTINPKFARFIRLKVLKRFTVINS